MNKGEIEKIGYADDIYNNPTKEYTKGLISAIPKGELEDIKRKMSQAS
jgi:peptide/nickel transport system ATP-binding protein